jgi:hypothetical protein
MGLIIGPTSWWQLNLIPACPAGTTLLDGSRIICKSSGTAWIVAPSYTEVTRTWNGTTTLLVGDKPCVCDWPTLNTCLINRGFNPSDWFVPSISQLQNPGWVCRTQWDSFSNTCYWSSTEFNSTRAWTLCNANGSACCNFNKAYDVVSIRAFRCVTY